VLIGVALAWVASWFFLQAVPRAEGSLRGWRGSALGLALAALAVWAVRVNGWGLAVSVSAVLGLVILAVPALSYLQARRSAARRHKAAA
jgi:hypothetical protein